MIRFLNRRVPAWMLVLTVYLSAAVALAQIAPSPVHPSSSGGGIATSVSAAAFPLLAPDGSAAAPSYSFSSATGTGIFRNTGNATLTFSHSGTARFSVGGGATQGVRLQDVGQYQWVSGSDPSASGSVDTGLARESAGNVNITNGSTTEYVRLGDAGSGISQVFLNPNSSSDSQVLFGAAVTQAQLRGGADLRVRFSGQERHYFRAGARALTDATNTTVFTMALGDDRSAGGTISFCVVASDAVTTRQVTCGNVNYAGIDVTAGAGGEACSAAVTGTNSTAVSAGTLTVTATATTGTDLCNIQLNADTSFATPTTLDVRWEASLNGDFAASLITPL